MSGWGPLETAGVQSMVADAGRQVAEAAQTLPGFGRTLRMALRLDSEIFTLIQTSPMGLRVALLVVVAAALSESIGQSVILLLNRVRPWRFLLAVSTAVIANVIGYLIWSTAIWLTVWLVFGVQARFVTALAVVGLAYAPQIFSFFAMTPYFGSFFDLVLSLWSVAATVVALWAGMALQAWQAAAAGVVSWLAIQLWRRSIGRPIYALGRIIQRRIAGNKLAWTLDDLREGKLQRDELSSNWKAWVQQQREALRTMTTRRDKEGPPDA